MIPESADPNWLSMIASKQLSAIGFPPRGVVIVQLSPGVPTPFARTNRM
jgi:hypothetical protein